MPENEMKIIKGLKIDPVIFTQQFVPGCDICKCSGECCYYGVYTESNEHENILKIKDKIIEEMDDSQTKVVKNWFEEPIEDDDFTSGIAVGTEVYNGKCVFLDKQGFCTLQKIAMKEGVHKWKYKPLYCILFPLVIWEGKFTIDEDHLKRMNYCNKKEIYSADLFKIFQEEIKHVFGEDGFKELLEYKDEFLKIKKSEENIES